MFCASESATAVCKSNSASSSATIHLGRSASASAHAIDRHNPIIHASRRSLSSSHHQNLKPGRNSTSSLVDQSQTTAAAAGAERRKSSASLVDAVRKSSCIKPSAFFSPPPFRTHLLLTKTQSCHLEQKPQSSDRQPAVLPTEVGEKAKDPKAGEGKLVRCTSLKNDAPLFTVPSSDKYYYSPFRISSHQVVVVRVALHCKGCAGKVKKYISRMQGVTSFNVDFDAKKVIVVGNVTPLEVLASISKVRTAQLLPPEKPNPSLAPQTNCPKKVTWELIET